MKINGWSVVKSPIGVSLRGMDGDMYSAREICVARVGEKLRISVHEDGRDEVLCEFYVAPNFYK